MRRIPLAALLCCIACFPAIRERTIDVRVRTSSADADRILAQHDSMIEGSIWTQEGFAEPVSKGRMAALVSDWNWQQTSDSLSLLHAVYAGHAASTVTAHDARTWADVPLCKPAASGAAR